jgi:drug/metabolite transporter (DMT)-like permease
MAVGSALLLATSAVLGEPWRLPALTATWLALAWLITSASVAFILMVWLLSQWTASATSYGSVVQPLVTVAVGSWLAGEQVTLTFALGSVLALAGVYWGALTARTEREPAQSPAVERPVEPRAA